MENLQILSKGRSGSLLLEVCEGLKREIADIRTPLQVKAEIENQVRLALIGLIDTHLVNKIKGYRGEVKPQFPEEYQ